MKQVPLTLASAATALPGGLRPAHSTPVRAERTPLLVSWAQHTDEVREAQRLRFQVFGQEMGARLSASLAGHDIDRFDDYCEHLLVRDAATREVVGTYRLLTPAQALRAGGTYGDNEFDLAPLTSLRPRMVELGRGCVHAGYRHGGVINALWKALAQFMIRNSLDTMMGCASIPMQQLTPHGLTRGGMAAASIWQQLRLTHLAPAQLQVLPRCPLPLPLPTLDPAIAARVEPPALIKAYLRLGSRVLGPPAWDPDFDTADLPLLMHVADLPARYQRASVG